MSVLDLGVGTGNLALRFSALGCACGALITHPPCWRKRGPNCRRPVSSCTTCAILFPLNSTAASTASCRDTPFIPSSCPKKCADLTTRAGACGTRRERDHC